MTRESGPARRPQHPAALVGNLAWLAIERVAASLQVECCSASSAPALGRRHLEGGGMRIGVLGAGSIGGHLAVMLANAGHHVTVIARGAHLDAIRRNGLRLVFADGTETLGRGIVGTASIGDAGKQDV